MTRDEMMNRIGEVLDFGTINEHLAAALNAEAQDRDASEHWQALSVELAEIAGLAAKLAVRSPR